MDRDDLEAALISEHERIRIGYSVPVANLLCRQKIVPAECRQKTCKVADNVWPERIIGAARPAR
jgi:hypothetical protein